MSVEAGFGFWAVVNGVTTLGVVGGGAWLLSVASSQREMTSWRGNVETQIKTVDKRSERSHDAVIELKSDVKHIISDIADIKSSQDATLDKVTELVSRVPPHMGQGHG